MQKITFDTFVCVHISTFSSLFNTSLKCNECILYVRDLLSYPFIIVKEMCTVWVIKWRHLTSAVLQGKYKYKDLLK